MSTTWAQRHQGVESSMDHDGSRGVVSFAVLADGDPVQPGRPEQPPWRRGHGQCGVWRCVARGSGKFGVRGGRWKGSCGGRRRCDRYAAGLSSSTSRRPLPHIRMASLALELTPPLSYQGKPIQTEITPAGKWWDAEEYHQQYCKWKQQSRA